MSKSRVFLFLWMISLFVPVGLNQMPTLWAQAPNSISYSGLLTNAQGEPREGTFNMTFRIYDRPVGGPPQYPPLHEQRIDNVVARKGQFSVLLGPFNNPNVLQGNGERYVEVQVGNEPALLPRQQWVSVPFAQRTASIDGARGGSITGGVAVNGNVGIGTASPVYRLDVHESGGLNVPAIRAVTGGGPPHVGGGMLMVPNLGPGGYNPLSHSGDVGLIYFRNTTDTASLVIGEWSGAARGIRIDTAGNVGIGAPDPQAKLHVAGNFIATGSKSALVETASYGKRQLYAMESPENWFEDFGTAQLEEDQVVVELDKIFAQTVNTELDYHVFLTPKGRCALYVAETTPISFKVELLSGATGCKFDYRIVAKRKEYEKVRLEEVKAPEAKEVKK